MAATARRTVSLPAYAVERVDDLVQTLIDDGAAGRSLTRADVVSALIYAAPAEPAGLARLVRLGRMERFADEGQRFEPNADAYAECERTAIALGWRGRGDA
jgi:hypothetical protein